MQTEIKGGSAFSYLEVELAPGETILAESDAMASMDAALDMRARFNGGLLMALLLRFLGGESLFINLFVNASKAARRLTLVQPTPGEIRCVELNNTSLCLQGGAFLACTSGVKLSLRWSGLVSWIAGEGLFKLMVSGVGKVWYGGYGALIEKPVDGEYIVDSGHLLAWDPQIRLRLQLSGGIFSSLFGGEGLVTRVEGKGSVIVQTRNIDGLTSWLNPRL